MTRERIAVTYNDGLDTWVKTYSARRRADQIATSIRERGIAARVEDRGVKGIRRAERYRIVVAKADFGEAMSLAVHYGQVYDGYDNIAQEAKQQ
jgi:hypothetical protein